MIHLPGLDQLTDGLQHAISINAEKYLNVIKQTVGMDDLADLTKRHITVAELEKWAADPAAHQKFKEGFFKLMDFIGKNKPARSELGYQVKDFVMSRIGG